MATPRQSLQSGALAIGRIAPVAHRIAGADMMV